MTIMICGLGSIGRRHLRNLQALSREDIVLLRTGKSTLPEDELEGLQVEQNLGDAISRWSPEAAVISNPSSLHLEVAIPLAEIGCHLLLEKPVSDSMDQVDELQAAISRGGGRVVVGFQYRFHPGLRKVKQLLTKGMIGRPLSASVHWDEYLPDWHPWEDYLLSYSARNDLGGGVVLTLCHPFDYLRWMFGEVKNVTAETGALGDLKVEVEDTAEIILNFQNGALARIHLGYNQRPASHRLEIVGTEGTICWDGLEGSIRWWSKEKGDWQVMNPPQEFERNSMFLEEMRHFLEVCEGQAEPLSTLEDGIRALEIALMAKRSSSEGRRITAGDKL